MEENEAPSKCPFCKTRHTIDLLKVQVESVAHCPDCKKLYFVPYSEIKSLLSFHDDLKALVSSKESD